MLKKKEVITNNEISELCTFSLGGYQQKVLIEGKSKNNENTYTGRTDSNKVVILDQNEDLTGKVLDVKIVSEHMWYLKGECMNGQ